MAMNAQKAIQRINERGILLVFPIKNRTEVPSLWHEFYPRSQMTWQWDEDADGRVSRLWVLMKKLSTDPNVVYSKWYQGRATFFSKEIFSAMLCLVYNSPKAMSDPPYGASALLEALEESSPLSTKELKAVTDLQGKLNASIYTRALNWLFARFQIVGYGEVDDGAFPSLAVGSTRLIFEELWNEARAMNSEDARRTVDRMLPESSAFRKFADKITQ